MKARAMSALVILAVYADLPTRNYFWDGVYFAQTVESASRWAELLHPNHLVYNFLGYALYHLMEALDLFNRDSRRACGAPAS